MLAAISYNKQNNNNYMEGFKMKIKINIDTVICKEDQLPDGIEIEINGVNFGYTGLSREKLLTEITDIIKPYLND